MTGQPVYEDPEQLKRLLIPLAKAIATTVGPRCEVVLHDLRKMEDDGSTIVWIENGHVTGRRVGGPTTNLGLEALRSKANPDRYDYRSVLPDGRVLRSSSVYFRNSAGDLIAALCINLDITDFLAAIGALDTLVGSEQTTVPMTADAEVFGASIDDVLNAMIASAAATIGAPPQTLGRSGRIAFVKLLDVRGAFQVKRSIEVVSQSMGISWATLYAYLEGARGTASDGKVDENRTKNVRSDPGTLVHVAENS